MTKEQKKRIGLRVSMDLYEKLEAFSKKMGMTVNQITLYLLAKALYNEEMAMGIMTDDRMLKLLSDKASELFSIE